MSSEMLPTSPADEPLASQAASTDSVDGVDLYESFARIRRGAFQIAGFALIGLTLGLLATLAIKLLLPNTTTAKVFFAFPGFEKGEYPDKSKFQPDDLRAPSIIGEALKHQGFELSSELQSKIRGDLSIEAIIPPNISRERDRLRASGQTPPPFTANEYLLTLTMRSSLQMNDGVRRRLLNEIVSVYRENFQQTYGQLPSHFGEAFGALKNGDFPEYELMLTREIESIELFLKEHAEDAPSFRSRTTNLSFQDLADQALLFSEIRLNESLGLIHENGLSRNRRSAMTKMDYNLRLIDDQERKALEDESVVKNLLQQAQSKDQSYVLGIKTGNEDSRKQAPIVDQGLIESLLQNDAYNFLIRSALTAGLHVKDVQAEKSRLVEIRDNMKSFMGRNVDDQSAVVQLVQTSLAEAEGAHRVLIENIRKTYTDYSQQQFADAVRISDQVRGQELLIPILISAAVGLIAGASLGTGLSLLGFYLARDYRRWSTKVRNSFM